MICGGVVDYGKVLRFNTLSVSLGQDMLHQQAPPDRGDSEPGRFVAHTGGPSGLVQGQLQFRTKLAEHPHLECH